MVITRNNTDTSLNLPPPTRRQPVPGHFQLLEINPRCALTREMKALGLTEGGSLTQAAKDAILHPSPKPTVPSRWWAPAINPHYCQEIIKIGRYDQPRQCKRRPSRGSQFCHSHDVATRTDATAARQAVLTRQRDLVRQQTIQNQRFERQDMHNAKRFGPPDRFVPINPAALATDYVFAVRRDWGTNLGYTARQVEHILDGPQRNYSDDRRRPFHDRAVLQDVDGRERQRLERLGQTGDNRTRCLDFVYFRVNRDRCAICVAHKCNVCRKFAYPFPTSIVPERQTIKCNQCDARVHRHCQGGVVPFYADHLYKCQACP